MALEEVVDTLEAIDERYQDLYTKNDEGKFEINISGLKSALTKERETRRKYEKELKNMDNSDQTDEELKKQLESANSTIRNMKIDSVLRSRAVQSGIDKDYVDDVIALTKSNFGLDEDGHVVRVDKQGNPTGKKVEDFFDIEFKRNKPRFYNSSGKKGGGSSTNIGDDISTPDSELQKAKKNKDLNKLINLKQNKH